MYRETSVGLICTYDSVADAAYIYFDHPIPFGAAQTVISFDTKIGMFNLDLNSDGHVIGLEILGASRRLPPALLTKILEQDEPKADLP
jgi:uncharacterized protein YuzE